MLSGLLLATQLLLMSNRASFWDPEKVSSQTQIVQEPTDKETSLSQIDMTGKRILVLVHGYNNTANEALSTYRLIHANLSALARGEETPFYDYIIGYLWPGYDDTWEYFQAKQHVPRLAKRMRAHLEALAHSSEHVDVLAHSMGNYLMLETLNYTPTEDKKIVRNYYSLAAAVDDEVLEKKEKYYNSTQNCEKLFVFYSERDEVLKWGFSVAEWDNALGFKGAEHPDRLSQNVQLINYTSFVDEHSGYFTYLPIYRFIESALSSRSEIAKK